ncbi:MAG: alkaline phosphatase family protein [Planctomycetota bacterium]|nr:alkaline phosphatase family protein [Planctomycetaceae bacterium]MDQ3331554.1 alkaline phosphatase family protein [Planctomycetota bacterium]
MIHRIIALLMVLLLSRITLAGERKVLFIGIDGCRPDAIAKADTPNLDRLIKEGAYSTNTSILGPRECGNETVSGPGWSSIYTGVWADKHGVKDNEFEGSNYDRYPHFFSLLRQKRPDAITAAFCDWKPIADKIVSQATVNECPTEELKGAEAYVAADEKLAQQAAEFLKSEDADVVCVYFGQVDETGHAKGFHPTVPEYVAAIETVDRHLGALLQAIAARPHAADEEWLVVATTDHGGQGLRHSDGHKIDEIRRVFLLASGPGVKKANGDPQTYIVDAVPTALAWLGVEIDPKWELDGTAFGAE